MQVIYIAGKWAIRVMSLGGCIALTPHLNSAHMECDFNQPPEFWYEGDIEIMLRCDAVFMLPNWLGVQGRDP